MEIIRDVSLEISQGEFVVLVGPSGCGKSTLLRCIAGLEKIADGKLIIDGEDMTAATPSERGVAMVFQSYALYPHMTVAENIGFGLRIAGTPKPAITEKVLDISKLLKLDHLLHRKPKALSGGQRQRVAIGRALARNPRVFLFDEPLSNLDAALRAEMRVELAKLHHRLGSTMIYVTHDQVEAMTLADRIVVMRDGRIEQEGRPLDLFNKPVNKFVASFLGQPPMNFIEVESIARDVNGSVAEFKDGSTIRLPQMTATIPRSKITLGIRPDDFVIGSTDGFTFRTEVVEHLGDETLCYGVVSDGQPLTAKFKGQAPIKSGEILLLSTNGKHIHQFDLEGAAV
nr:ABC transporter ATP-binding protein [Rhizobium tubonense]